MLVRRLSTFLPRIEIFLLLAAVASLWTVATRPWTPLLLLIPVFFVRLVLYRRLWTPTLLDPFLILFIGLAAINPAIAPFTRNWTWQLAFPLTGILLIVAFAEYARIRGSTEKLVMLTLALGMLVGVLALGSSQWTSKSVYFKSITDALPTIRNFPGAIKGFNVNEIGGALAWLIPFAGGIAIFEWRKTSNHHRRFYATLVFFLIWAGLVLGQSRMAIFGVIAAMALLIVTLIHKRVWQAAALAVLVAFTAFQLALMSGLLYDNAALLERDESSFAGRIEIWSAGLAAVRNHPLTGVGVNMFRVSDVRDAYPVPGYEDRVLPHTHNELLQVAADLGIPGLLLFAAWHVVLVIMVVRIWRQGDDYARAVSMSAFAALIAHAVFGIADAVTLWDRFAFIFWWMVALIVAQYVLTVRALK